MAKGKHIAWHDPAKLEKLTNWAMKGLTDDEIAQNVGVHRSTLYDWFSKYSDISDAVKTGREMAVECLENMAFRVAMGLAEEEHVVKLREPGGGERVTVVKRRLPPNAPMLMFLLKNRAGYRSEPETTINVETAPRFYFDREQAEAD